MPRHSSMVVLLSGCLGMFPGAQPAPGQQPLSPPGAPAQDPRILDDLSPASLDRVARVWVGSAASGDLIPAVTVEAPVTEIPSTYFADVAILQDTSSRCRWRPERGRRSLLLCVDDWGYFPRNDTPRAQLVAPRIPTPGRSNRPPRGQVDVLVR